MGLIGVSSQYQGPWGRCDPTDGVWQGASAGAKRDELGLLFESSGISAMPEGFLQGFSHVNSTEKWLGGSAAVVDGLPSRLSR